MNEQSSYETNRFNDSIVRLLNEKLKRYYDCNRPATLSSTTCIEIYNVIFETLVNVMIRSGVKLTNDAMNYVAQLYYDLTQVNNRQELDPNVITHRIKEEDISTKELVLLTSFFNNTYMATPLIKEIKKRS